MKKSLFFSVLIVVVLIGCSAALPPTSEIIGIWQTAIAGGTETLQFNQDGTFSDSSDTFATKTGTWAVSGSTLTMIYPASTLTATISFPDYNTMIMTPSGGSAETWARLGSL